jgi:hypothetical protein
VQFYWTITYMLSVLKERKVKIQKWLTDKRFF